MDDTLHPAAGGSPHSEPLKLGGRMKVTMQHARTTKNTYRYEAENPLLPVIYVHKATFPDGPPPSIVVTVEAI